MEKLIKQKLIERGFKEETLLNNRGLIGACIEETEQQLRLYGVVDSLTSKEAIDYQIYAKRKDKEENLKSWLYAMFFGIMFFVGLFAILKSCSS